ncbi:hypothetical protein M8818_003349 [Zalaria obscura]|uniref:Uncharacterized protein n=1 Tax=Zalaria obscura TaxID=2024903 RepID=A0ACC3SGT9_9PEZI
MSTALDVIDCNGRGECSFVVRKCKDLLAGRPDWSRIKHDLQSIWTQSLVTCQQNNQECGGYANESGSVSQSSNGSAQRKVKSEFGHNQQDGELHHSTPHRNDSTAGVSTIAGNTVGSEESHATGTTHTEEASEHTEHALFSGPRNRMPYFRWLGPTAIMPGFKQMVVKVKQHDSGAHSSTDGGDVVSPSLNSGPRNTLHRHSSVFSTTPAPVESDMRTPLALPFYDTSSMPPSELITHLCTTFFTHLGCNFPFLQQERFLKDLEEKQVDAILVDAVCALAARFSTHTLLTQQSADIKATPAEYGQAFAQRGKNALTDTFAMPTVAAVQAALLLAYNEFGESRDSGLWVYLGIAIRMAQDLGLQKVEGLKYEGINGPTPKMLCYKALESLDVYWSGTRYILTVLDQKFKGVGDPLLYTVEEGRSSLEAPKPEPSFTSPGWRRKISWAPYLPDNNAGTALKTQLLQGRSAMDKTGAAVDPNQGMLLLLGMVQETRHLRSTAIGWTLTGTLNSPSTNLAWHYPTANGGSMPYGMSSPEEFASTRSSLPGPRQQAQSQRPSLDRNSSQTYIAHPTLHQKPSVSHFPAATPTPGNEALSNRRGSYQPSPSNLDHMAFPADSNFTFDSSFQPFSDLSGQSSGQFGDMLIESQDVDMSLLGLDALPWFDLQHDDMLPLFDGSGNGTIPGLDGQHLDPRSPNSGLR